jgi:hypothetical protein
VADADDSPQLVGPPLPAICGGDSAEVGGTLANAKTGNCEEIGKAPFRGPFRSGPVSRILSRATIYLTGTEAPRGRRSGPAAYLDLAGQGRRSCLALHRAGFAWPPRHRGAGALLPHHFTFACTQLTCGCAIGRVFLWHFPAGFPGWALPTALALWCPDFPRGVFSPPAVARPAPQWYRRGGKLATIASNILRGCQ